MQVNPINIFKFLEKKDNRPIPFKVKLIYKLPLTPEDLNVKGKLDLEDTELTELPDNLKVSRHLFLSDTKITTLPKNLKVGGDLYLMRSTITSLPDNLKVGGDLDIRNTNITELPVGLKIRGDFYLMNTPLADEYLKQSNGVQEKAISTLIRDIESKGGSITGTIDIIPFKIRFD